MYERFQREDCNESQLLEYLVMCYIRADIEERRGGKVGPVVVSVVVSEIMSYFLRSDKRLRFNRGTSCFGDYFHFYL